MSDFQKILSACKQIASEHPGHVFIGGVATYLHAVNKSRTRKNAEASHDADFMISLADFADLRDTDEVVPNRRLSKHQLIRDGVEFDVYVQHQNKLAVPFEDAFEKAVTYGDVKVACPEHLLILKTNAAIDRDGSAKGDKDARDIVMIADVMDGKIRRELIEPYLRAKHVQMAAKIADSGIFMTLAKGNAHAAKTSRTMFSSFVSALSKIEST